MGKSQGRRQFTFTLYENNEKDRAVISFLDKISQSVRGKVLRGFVLDQFFEGMEFEVSSVNNTGNDKIEKTKSYDNYEINKAKNEHIVNRKSKDDEEEDTNPFNGLQI